jgi:hypothetical protein
MARVLRHIVALPLVAVGALAFFVLGWVIVKPEYTHHEIEGGATALALLALTAAYTATHWRSSLHWLGMPAYLLSCAAVVWVLPAWINGVFKGFAPADRAEATQAFWEGIACLTVIGIASLSAWLLVTRLSAKQHSQNVGVS